MKRIMFAIGTLLALGLWALLRFVDKLVGEYGEEELMGTDRSSFESLAYWHDWS